MSRDVPNYTAADASLAVQPDGKIVTGYEAGGAETVSRYNADGSPDESFGTGGAITFGNHFKGPMNREPGVSLVYRF
jgi:hypothetical protein